MSTREAVNGLSQHDLLVQLLWAREKTFLRDGELDADMLAYLIEEVLDLAGDR
jgi:hypothetical protein